MNENSYILTFPNVSVAEANRYAGELQDQLQAALPEAQILRRRANPHTQDLGSFLVMILGTSSITAVAVGIQSWLQKRQSASITIECPEKKLIASNITSKDALRLTEIFLNEE